LAAVFFATLLTAFVTVFFFIVFAAAFFDAGEIFATSVPQQ
jgi:hypothetical protein